MAMLVRVTLSFLLVFVPRGNGESESTNTCSKTVRVGVFVVHPFSTYNQAKDTWSGSDIELIRLLNTKLEGVKLQLNGFLNSLELFDKVCDKESVYVWKKYL